MKTVLITGGARRLGRALVTHYAQAGWRVLFTCMDSYEQGMELVDQCGAQIHCVRSSISTKSNACAVVAWAKGLTESIDLLICNASTFARSPVEQTRQVDFENILASNLVGPYFLIQQCLPLLRTVKGSVVNIADAQAEGGVAFFSPYIAAKAGMISITKSLAIELAPYVRINAILPGSLDMPESKIFLDAEEEKILGSIPMQHLGKWADIVRAVDYLESAKYVTGSCMTVDGGRSATY